MTVKDDISSIKLVVQQSTGRSSNNPPEGRRDQPSVSGQYYQKESYIFFNGDKYVSDLSFALS